MTEVEIYAALANIFRDIFGTATIAPGPETTPKDVEGWDSFNMVNLIVAVEHRFGVTVEAREVTALRCVGDLVVLIAKDGAG